jgi:plastocyanin
MVQHIGRRGSAVFVLGAAALGIFASQVARAQTTCKTPNCVVGGEPVECQRHAAPRRVRVDMTTSGFDFVFVPSNPKIEPGGCVEWRALTVTHSSSDTTCSDDAFCSSPPVPACLWETGNVASGAGGNSSAVCFYSAASFPAATTDAYYCRIHASPTVGTMRGNLRITTAINVTIEKDAGLGDVVLSWTGGGVSGDETFKVAKSNDDRTFAPANTTTTDPTGGPTGRTFRDAGELAQGDTHYYLIRNRQPNE